MGRMGLGRNHYERKNYDLAIKEFDKVIALNSDYAQGYLYRAEALFFIPVERTPEVGCSINRLPFERYRLTTGTRIQLLHRPYD